MQMVTYEREFKERALQMAQEEGAICAARSLGVPVNTMYGWLHQAKKHGSRAFIGSGRQRAIPANDEAAKQAKRIKELERANEILKEALGFFVASQKK
jgi:transposase